MFLYLQIIPSIISKAEMTRLCITIKSCVNWTQQEGYIFQAKGILLMQLLLLLFLASWWLKQSCVVTWHNIVTSVTYYTYKIEATWFEIRQHFSQFYPNRHLDLSLSTKSFLSIMAIRKRNVISKLQASFKNNIF